MKKATPPKQPAPQKPEDIDTTKQKDDEAIHSETQGEGEEGGEEDPPPATGPGGNNPPPPDKP